MYKPNKISNLFFRRTSQYLANNSGDLDVDFGPDVTALLLTNLPHAYIIIFSMQGFFKLNILVPKYCL